MSFKKIIFELIYLFLNQSLLNHRNMLIRKIKIKNLKLIEEID